MKKILFSILFLLLLFSFASCAEKGESMFFRIYHSEKKADATFNEIVDAIKQRDASKIVATFSKTIQNENNLSQDALSLIDFVHGDITSVSSASEAGVGTDHETNKGKRKKVILSSFCIVTSETKYYIAIKECVRDEFDNSNEGVLSVYIIKSSNWTEDYVYRGDGKWSQGINIVD